MKGINTTIRPDWENMATSQQIFRVEGPFHGPYDPEADFVSLPYFQENAAYHYHIGSPSGPLHSYSEELNGPALVLKSSGESCGEHLWFKYGILHREGGPAVRNFDTETPDCHGEYEGDFWYLDGEYHREDGGPATFCGGVRSWYKHGKYHRDSGPAYIENMGKGVVSLSWYLEGISFREERVKKSYLIEQYGPDPWTWYVD